MNPEWNASLQVNNAHWLEARHDMLTALEHNYNMSRQQVLDHIITERSPSSKADMVSVPTWVAYTKDAVVVQPDNARDMAYVVDC